MTWQTNHFSDLTFCLKHCIKTLCVNCIKQTLSRYYHMQIRTKYLTIGLIVLVGYN